jgi:hypothetical protein
MSGTKAVLQFTVITGLAQGGFFLKKRRSAEKVSFDAN